MPTDASGPTTALGIPTYATSADAPSGVGFNNTMQVIDTLIAQRLKVTGSPSANQAVVWNGSAWVPALVSNANIDAAAAIALSKLAGYPGDGTKFAAGDGTWKAASATTYRRTTATTVNNTIAETDLLGGSITVGAGALGTSGVLRLTVWGDWLQNSGAGTSPPRIKLKLGATTLLDTNALGAVAGTSASRFPFYVEALIANQGAANTQWASIKGKFLHVNGNVFSQNPFTTGEGTYWSVMAASLPNVSSEFVGGNSGAVDTTASQALVLSVINPTASASMETKLIGALVEVI